MPLFGGFGWSLRSKLQAHKPEAFGQGAFGFGVGRAPRRGGAGRGRSGDVRPLGILPAARLGDLPVHEFEKTVKFRVVAEGYNRP
jgi:hypothetical protein